MAGQFSLSDLSGILGTEIYNPLYESLGFSGYGDGYSGANPWMDDFGVNEGGQSVWLSSPNDDAENALNSYSFDWQPQGGQAGQLTAYDPSGKSTGKYTQTNPDWFDQAAGFLIPALVTGGFGSAIGGALGGGMVGSAAGQGIASGTMSSMQGGNFGQGFVSGAVGGGLQGLAQGTSSVAGNNPSAYSPGTAGTSVAGYSGVTNPTLAGMVNRGSGSFLGSLASGKNGSEALQSGLTGAALSGLNSAGKGAMDFYKNSLNSWLSPEGTTDFVDLQGSGGDMSGQTDVSTNRYAEMLTGSDGMETYNPDYRYGGDQVPPGFSLGNTPQQSIQSSGQPSFSLPSFLGDAGRGLGNFASNNAGDLASMLYGFYNNRKQQRGLQGQMNQVNQATTQLQNMFGQNSPYAQQLRNQLAAKAAQSGRRSNTAGRETQFQAMLADKAASTLPQIANMQNSMLQAQQARGGLQNNNMNMLLQGVNRLGGFKALGQGLQGLFSPQASLTGPGSFNAYSNLDDMYGSVG